MVDVKKIKLCSVQKQIGSGDERLFSVRRYVCLDKSVIKKIKRKKERKHKHEKKFCYSNN